MSEAESQVFGLTEAAMRRLEASVGRLQQVVERETGREAGLVEELGNARADLAALQEVTREVSGRLDAAILRLRSVIEG